MKRRLKIAHKGLILISLTLIVELIFLGVLVLLLIQADNAIKREVKSKQIIYTASNIARYTIECGTSAAVYKFNRQKNYRDRAVNAVQLAAKDVDVLESLLKDDPRQVERMKKCKAVMLEGRRRIELLVKKMDQDDEIIPILVKGQLRPEREIVDGMAQELYGIVEAERESAKSYATQERSARQAVINALVAGIVLNILLAVGAAVFFFQDIAKRIQVVIDNTHRLPKKLPFNQPIGGNDEIAELDSAFHSTAKELQESEEMKRMLIGMVSHDLRSPLTSVSAGLELLKEGVVGELPEDAKKTVAQASSDVSRLLRLTDDLLDAERIASGSIDLRRREISAKDLVEDVLESMETVSQQHGVKLQSQGDNFEFNADHERLCQVLVNLVSNAIKFSPEGETVNLTFAKTASNAEFRVTDRGPGIPAEHHARIFEKFTQVKNADSSIEGKGLGLTICKSLVELHGGSIQVESSNGKGTTFCVSIPLKV